MAEQEEDYSSLPLPERFAHKNWKVRKEAYEAAAKEFDTAQTEADPVVRQFVQDSNIWKGAVTDANAAAHQEALAALCSFLNIAGLHGCTRTRHETIPPLAEKGLTSSKPAAKQKALDALLLYVEMDKPDPVLEELLPSLSHKTPKVVTATLVALTAIYHEFGVKTVEPKQVLKLLPKAFGHADKNVRAEAQNLAVEFYRWLGESMKPLFWNDLKPVQQQDLETLFVKVGNEGPPKPQRLLRSQQAKAAAAAEAAAAAAEEEVDMEEAQEDDDVDLEPDAVDVIPKVPKDLQDRLASTKWKDRKEALDELQIAISVPNIQEGPFDDIIRGLAKSMKDANIAVVTVAANCIELLAKGLKKSFAKYRSTILSPIIERLKERKQSVTDALAAALDAVFASTSLSDCMEEISAGLQHKNPQVKLESTRFLIRCLKTTRQAPDLPEVKQISDLATKQLSDSQESQRNAGAEVLGVLLKIMGERIMNAHFEGLDDIRKAKIKEFCDAAEVKAKYKPKAAAPPPKPVATGPPGKRPTAIRKAPAGVLPGAKKPAPAAAVVDELPPTPLQPKPTARPGLQKPGAPRSLKPPTAGGAGGKKLAAPGSIAGKSQPGTPRKTAQSPSMEEEPTPAPKVSRGLTGRPLGKVNEPQPPAPPSPSTITQHLPSAERIELEELRAEVERLRSTNESLRSEHLKLMSQVHELQDQNAQLIEDHTRDVLTIKAKETQLVRARGDAESAEETSVQLQREVDRLKRELGRMGRATSPRAAPDYAAFTDARYGANVNGADIPPSRTRPFSPNSGSTTPYAESNSYQTHAPPAQPAPQQREGKENLPLQDEVKQNPVLSPRAAGLPSRPLSRPGSASQSQSQSPARPASYGAAPRAHLPRKDSSGANGVSDGEARSLGSSGSSAGGGTGGQAGQSGKGEGQESWRRAAEVTQNLKARIELMRQRQGMSGR